MRHFFQGDYGEGDRLAKKHLEPEKLNFGTNLGLCQVVLEFEQHMKPSEGGRQDAAAEPLFHRELDLEGGGGTFFYEIDGAEITREVFASHADQVIVSRIRSSHGSLGVSFRISIRGENGPFMLP